MKYESDVSTRFFSSMELTVLSESLMAISSWLLGLTVLREFFVILFITLYSSILSVGDTHSCVFKSKSNNNETTVNENLVIIIILLCFNLNTFKCFFLMSLKFNKLKNKLSNWKIFKSKKKYVQGLLWAITKSSFHFRKNK